MHATMEGGNGENGGDKKKERRNIIPFPNRQGGFEEIAQDLIKELEEQVLKISDPAIHVEVELQTEALLNAEGFENERQRALALQNQLEKSEREPKEKLYSNRHAVIHYLAVAQAYLRIDPKDRKSLEEEWKV